MKVEQLSLADYNKIKNIPVVNQDLSASGFTPVANMYYRHTGATGTFTQGVIYYYDGTEYKALDGSGGGGTTLNKYTYTVAKSTNGITREQANTLARILENAKSITKTKLRFLDTVIDVANAVFLQGGHYNNNGYIYGHFVCYVSVNSENRMVIGNISLSSATSSFQHSCLVSFSTENTSRTVYMDLPVLGIEITYLNDTEIT